MLVNMSTALAAIALAVQLASTQAENVVVKAMSFNVRTSQASVDRQATCSNWEGVRQGNVVGQFESVGADFVGTQETSDEQKAFLDGKLAATYKSVGARSGSLNGMASEFNAIYYKFGDWKVLSEGTHWLGPNPDAPSAAWGMQYYRTLVYGRFEHIKTGTTVCVFNTHYETPGNNLAQNEGSKIIIAKRAQVCQPGDKLNVLTGDFNAKPDYQAMQTLFADNWLEESKDPTFCGNMDSPACQEKFDFTLYKLSGDGCQEKSEVIRQSFGGCYPSDHAVLVSTWCLGTSCCGATESPAPTTAPPVEPTANQTSSTGSGANEAEIKPGVVVPGPVLAGGTPPAGGSSAAGAGAGGDSAKSATGAGGAGTEISTQSEGTTDATGTVFTIVGVIAAVAGVCAFVIKKKRALEATLEDQKPGLAPLPFFRRSDQEALSPVRRTTNKTMSRKFSSPVPTLEMSQGERDRSISQSSSIPCSRRSSIPLSIEEDDYMERESSAVILDDDGRDTERGSSRLYFSEVVTDRPVMNKRNDFALL